MDISWVRRAAHSRGTRCEVETLRETDKKEKTHCDAPVRTSTIIEDQGQELLRREHCGPQPSLGDLSKKRRRRIVKATGRPPEKMASPLILSTFAQSIRYCDSGRCRKQASMHCSSLVATFALLASSVSAVEYLDGIYGPFVGRKQCVLRFSSAGGPAQVTFFAQMRLLRLEDQ